MRIKKTSNTRATSAKVLNVNSGSTTDTYSCDFINKKTVNIYDNASGTSSSINFDGNYEDYDYLIITSDVGTFLMYPKKHNTIIMSYTYYSDQLYQKYQVVSFEYDFSTEKSVAYTAMAGTYYANTNHSENLKIYKIVGVKF